MNSGHVQGLILVGIALIVLFQIPGQLRRGAVNWSYFPTESSKYHREKQPIRYWIYVLGGAFMGALMLVSGILLMLGIMAPFPGD